jgi:NAD(P)-dependent dehydrogenase (short-subunit alcohol dehydrogenase family)
VDVRTPDAVVVTGAGRGIGRAAALAIGGRGIPILCISRTMTCEATAAAINQGGGQAEACRLDLADYVATEKALLGWIATRPYRRLALVLAAAIIGPAGPLQEADLAGWARTLAVNLLGNLAVVRALTPRLRDARYGRILFFGGGGGAYAYPVLPAYAASKAAVVRATENLAHDFADAGDVAVVCLAPGAVETDMLREVRAAGGDVRSPGPVDDALAFIQAFIDSPKSRALSGRFVHARDGWREVLAESTVLTPEQWTLRRAE